MSLRPKICIVIEIVERNDGIQAFLTVLEPMLGSALVTIEPVKGDPARTGAGRVVSLSTRETDPRNQR